MPDDDFFKQLENDDDDDRILKALKSEDSNNYLSIKKHPRHKPQDDDDISKFMTIISYIIAGIGLIYIMTGNYETGLQILFFGPICLVAVFCVSCLFYNIIKGIIEAIQKNRRN